MAYLQLVVLMGLSIISALSLAVGAVASPTQTSPAHAKADPVVLSAPARTISPAQIQSMPPWVWWVTIALIPVGTIIGVMYGRQSVQHPDRTQTPDQTPDQTQQTPNPVEPAAIPKSESPAAETQTSRLSRVDGVDKLLADLHHPDPVQRHKVIWELGQRGDSRAVQPLVELISVSDSLQRSLILAAVSEIGLRTLQPMHRALLISLQDDSTDVRKNAIRDATRLSDLISPISALLQFAIDDEDGEVRETATWALKRLSRPPLSSTSIEPSLQPSQDNASLLPPLSDGDDSRQ